MDNDTALQGFRIAELPGGVATRYCGYLFARLGAQVTRVGATPGTAGDLYGRWLDAAKSSAASLDAADGPFDLIVAGQDGEAVAAAEAGVRGGPWASAVFVALTWFDPTGPYGSWKGTDETVQALSGVAYTFGEREGPPTLPQGHSPQILGGVNAFIAGLAALLELPGHRPRRVDVNILESAVCVSEVAALAALDGGSSRSSRLGAAWARHRKAEDAAVELRRFAVPAVAVQPAHALRYDPQLAGTGFWSTIERRYVGRHAQAAPVFRFDGVRPALRRRAPTLGEHADEVLSRVAAL